MFVLLVDLFVITCSFVKLESSEIFFPKEFLAMSFNNTDLGEFLLLLLISLSFSSCYNFLACVCSLKCELWPKIVQILCCYLWYEFTQNFPLKNRSFACFLLQLSLVSQKQSVLSYISYASNYLNFIMCFVYNGLIFVLEHSATHMLFPNCFGVAERDHGQPISREFSVWSPQPLG